ncbi:hypothetical protein IAT38_007807 [Cryptococcus sp. DSM 104549]
MPLAESQSIATFSPASPSPSVNITSLARFPNSIRSRIFVFLTRTNSKSVIYKIIRLSKRCYNGQLHRLYNPTAVLDKWTAAKFFYPLLSEGESAGPPRVLSAKMKEDLMNPEFEGYFSQKTKSRRHPSQESDPLMRKILLIGGVGGIRIRDEEGLKALLEAVAAFARLVERTDGANEEELGRWGVDDLPVKALYGWGRPSANQKKKRFPPLLFWNAKRVVFDEVFVTQLGADTGTLSDGLQRLRYQQPHFVKDFRKTDFCVHLPDATVSVGAAAALCRLLSGVRGSVFWHNIDPNELAPLKKEVCLQGGDECVFCISSQKPAAWRRSSRD